MLSDFTRLTQNEARCESPSLPEPLAQGPSMFHSLTNMTIAIIIYLEKGDRLASPQEAKLEIAR